MPELEESQSPLTNQVSASLPRIVPAPPRITPQVGRVASEPARDLGALVQSPGGIQRDQARRCIAQFRQCHGDLVAGCERYITASTEHLKSLRGMSSGEEECRIEHFDLLLAERLKASVEAIMEEFFPSAQTPSA